MTFMVRTVFLVFLLKICRTSVMFMCFLVQAKYLDTLECSSWAQCCERMFGGKKPASKTVLSCRCCMFSDIKCVLAVPHYSLPRIF